MFGNQLLKPQSHQIVRFVDRTIGCDLVQLRPIGNVCCDLLLRSHAVVYSLRLVVGHMLICMIIMYFYLLASIKQVYCKYIV